MIRSITRKKSEEEINRLLDGLSRVFVVGCGPSVNDIDLSQLKNEDTIAVNKAIDYVPNPNYFVTVDYTSIGKYSLDTTATKVFVVNFESSVKICSKE